MRADIAQPFLLAARGVLEQELGGEVGRGQVTVERGDFEAGEVTADVGVTGALSGAVMYQMSEATARAIVGHIAPPMLIVGRGGLMSSLDIPRLLVPLETRVGGID